MRKIKILAILWLFAGIIAVPVFGISLLNIMVLGHTAVPVVHQQLPQLEQAGEAFQPTSDQYHEICLLVKDLWERYEWLSYVQLFVFCPVIVISFYTFAVLISAIKRDSPKTTGEC